MYEYKVHYRTGRGAACGGGPGRARHTTDVAADVTCMACRARIPGRVTLASETRAGVSPSLSPDAYRESDWDRALDWIRENGRHTMCDQTEATRTYFTRMFSDRVAELRTPQWVAAWAGRAIDVLLAECVRGHDGMSSVLRELRTISGYDEKVWGDVVLQAIARSDMPGERPECECVHTPTPKEIREQKREELVEAFMMNAREIAEAIREEARDMLQEHFGSPVCSSGGRGRQVTSHSNECISLVSDDIRHDWGDDGTYDNGKMPAGVKVYGEVCTAFDSLAREGIIYADHEGHIHMRQQRLHR